MDNQELKPGQAVYLKHDVDRKYTFLGLWKDTIAIAHRVLKAEYGVFAYNLHGTGEVATVILPMDAVIFYK